MGNFVDFLDIKILFRGKRMHARENHFWCVDTIARALRVLKYKSIYHPMQTSLLQFSTRLLSSFQPMTTQLGLWLSWRLKKPCRLFAFDFWHSSVWNIKLIKFVFYSCYSRQKNPVKLGKKIKSAKLDISK